MIEICALILLAILGAANMWPRKKSWKQDWFEEEMKR